MSKKPLWENKKFSLPLILFALLAKFFYCGLQLKPLVVFTRTSLPLIGTLLNFCMKIRHKEISYHFLGSHIYALMGLIIKALISILQNESLGHYFQSF